MCFGGGDDKGAAIKVISSINRPAERDIKITLLLPESNSYFKEISVIAENNPNLNLLSNSPVVHDIMVNSDLAIIAPGTLSYEAASVGLPMLLVTTADNQNINACGWSKIGAGINLGSIENLDKDKMNTHIDELILNQEKLILMSENCFNAVDGKGPERTKIKILQSL